MLSVSQISSASSNVAARPDSRICATGSLKADSTDCGSWGIDSGASDDCIVRPTLSAGTTCRPQPKDAGSQRSIGHWIDPIGLVPMVKVLAKKRMSRPVFDPTGLVPVGETVARASIRRA
jgi:hypothetical protein